MYRSPWVLFAIIGQLSIAHADDVARQQKRAAAEALEKESKTVTGHAKAVECGQAYLDLYNQNQQATDADELVYNAMVCFERGASVGLAIQLGKQLLTSWPRSKLAPRAQARLAKLYERAGLFAQAADAMEQYAKQYAGEKDAIDALADATMLRRALGDDAKQIADTELFVRSVGPKSPKRAADLMFELVAVHARRGVDAKEKALRDYLKRFASAGSEEHAMRAYIELGETLWERACKVKPVDGLCMTVVRDRTLPLAPRKVKPAAGAKRCGPPTTATRAIVARDPKLVDEALKMFAQGEAAFGKLASPSPAATYWRARGKLVVADRDLETFLAIAFPTDLDFSPDKVKTKERSLLKFNDFIAAKQKTGAKATDQYSAILGLKDASGALAATARLGQLSQDFGVQLATAEIPKDVRSGEYAKEKIEAFCDQLEVVAEPLTARAIQSYDVCLQKASELGVVDKSSRLCARERAALGPSTYALTEELLPQLPLHFPVMEEEPVRAGNQSPAFRDAIRALWAVYGPQPIAAPKCAQLTKSFIEIATKEKSADAWLMAGLAHGRCNEVQKAMTAYGSALKLDPKDAKSISNLGELAYRAGDLATARARWEQAIAIDGKLFAAYVGLASLGLRELRTATTNRPKLEQDVQTHAASAMAVGNDGSPAPYVQLAILAIGKSQLPLAYYLVSRAAGITDAPYTELARGAARVAEGHSALANVEHASRMPWKIDETNLALAIEHLRLRRYNDAGNSLALIKTKSYDVLIARGIAARGTAKLADAEARYTEAIALDANRPEAHFNLGVLWKDYTAARATDPAAAKTAFKKAADSFRRVGTADAKALADDCDKAAAKL